MKGKVLKMLLTLILPVISCFALGIFLAESFSFGYASALMQNGGFSFVHSNTTMKIETGTTISNFTAVNGGGVYVSSGGMLVMNGGTFSNNTASSGSGHNIYNAGVFTMNGGVVGTSQGTQTGFGIFNTGTMNLFGGTIYDDIYSENSINMKMNAHVEGTITITDSSIITISDYAGITPSLNIVVSNERQDGLILKLSGSSSAPDLSEINITDFNGKLHNVRCKKSLTEDDTFEIELVTSVTLKIFKGSGIAAVSGGGSYDKGSNVTINMTSYDGYGSNGYYLERNGEVFLESSLSTITFSLNESMVLTAYANPNKYKIKFYSNGGSGSMDDMVCEVGQSYKLPGNKYSRDGYSFVKWKDKNETTYLNGQEILNLSLTHNDEISLVAQWTANKIKITLMSKNDIQSNNYSVQGYIYYEYDKNAYYSDEEMLKQVANISLPTISPTYYEFGGYKDESSGAFYVDSSGNIINNLYKNEYKDKILYADWNGVVLTIKFDPSKVGPIENGYTNGTSYIYYRYGKENLFYRSNNCMTEIKYIELPTSTNGDKCLGFYTKSGDTFGSTDYIDMSGYIKNYTLSDYILSNIDSIISNNKILTLYPKWRPMYSITFDMSNGGTCFVHQKQSYNITVGELPTPVRSGYAFVGWFTEKEYGTKVTNETKLTSTNETYYAHWQEMNVAFPVDNTNSSDNCRYVYYGFYPQSKQYSTVGDFTKIGLADGNNCYYQGSDGNYYYLDGGTYYLYEPILWKVEKPENGEYAMTTVGILDVHDYQALSSEWLDSDFVDKILVTDWNGTYIECFVSHCLLSKEDYSSHKDVKYTYTSFGFSRSPSEYAYAKGKEKSNYWISETDLINNYFVVNGQNPNIIIGINLDDKNDKNDKYGIVPLIKVIVKDCSSSHNDLIIDDSWVNNGDLTHSRIVTKKCTNCGRKVIEEKEKENCLGITTIESDWEYCDTQQHRAQISIICEKCNTTSNSYLYKEHKTTTSSISSYSSDNDSTHSRIVSQFCSGCKSSFSVTDTQDHSKVNVYTSEGLTGHTLSSSCSICGWSNTSSTVTAHKMTNGVCSLCQYTPFLPYNIESFQSSNNYHCDDDDCLSQAVLCQDVLIDDKKKYSSEVVLEEKRYTNDVVQFPRIVG